MMRLLSREMLGSEWITLIVAYSTVMVTFVVVARVIASLGWRYL